MRANPVRFPATLPAEEGDTFVRYGNNASWDTGATDLNRWPSCPAATASATTPT